MSKQLALTLTAASLVIGVSAEAIGGYPPGIIVKPGETLTHINGIPVGQPRFSSHGVQPGTVVTPHRIARFNPHLGGWDTSNQQVSPSVYDPYREMSRNNGTMRYVQRPIYNRYGRVIGVSRGREWVNSVNGRRHWEYEDTTLNRFGGVHQINVAAVPMDPSHTSAGR